MKNAYTGPFPEFYRRFIDDCITLSSLTEPQLLDYVNFANNFHSAIKYTYHLSDIETSFMDLLIRLSAGRISTSIFYKPTDAHSYLDYNSSHSLSTRNSIPFSQFLRLRRLCMDDEDFASQCSLMVEFFRRRNYPASVLQHSLERAKSIPRQAALLPSPCSQEDRPIVVIPYHPHNLPIKGILLDNWYLLKNDPVVGEAFTSVPLVAYKRLSNIKDQLVRSRFRTPPVNVTQSAPGTHPCTKQGCRACPFLDTDTTVRGPRSTFQIHRSFHCQMCNVVYVISCRVCGKLYIGETERSFETRLKEHLSGVRLGNSNYPVARHFQTAGHSVQDLRAQILWLVKGDVVDRKHLEAWLISKLNTTSPFGLNLKSS